MINKILINSQTQFPITQTTPSFRSSKIWGHKAYKIEQDLAKRGINAEFENNGFVAECCNKAVKIFENTFGKSSLPSKISFEPISNKSTYACYCSYSNEIDVNSELDCFDSRKDLLKEMKENKRAFFLPDHFSTISPMHIFVHEFAHSAHYHNLEKRGNAYMMTWLRERQLPSAVARFITKFKLSDYSIYNMNEFIAERVGKDICGYLNRNEDAYIGSSGDINYSRIFDNKWNCRYISPQAYLDYYMQQVWNGDCNAMEKAENKIEIYLKEFERPQKQAQLKQHSLLGHIDNFFGKILSQADWLDELNKLKQKQ